MMIDFIESNKISFLSIVIDILCKNFFKREFRVWFDCISGVASAKDFIYYNVVCVISLLIANRTLSRNREVHDGNKDKKYMLIKYSQHNLIYL